MVIILYIEFVQLALMCYCKRKMSSAVNLYSDDVIVDVITIRGNSKVGWYSMVSERLAMRPSEPLVS
jgi:hypothetical protein